MNTCGAFNLARNSIRIQEGNSHREQCESEDEESQTEEPEVTPEQTPVIIAAMSKPPPAPKKKQRTAGEWEQKVGQ